MSRFPGIEAFILRTLEEEGEVRPPEARLAQEWFWQAASQLQARGLVVADQAAGIVRRIVEGEHLDCEPWSEPAHPLLCERCGKKPREAIGTLCAECLKSWGALSVAIDDLLDRARATADGADGVAAERARIRREMAAEIRLSFGAQIAAREGGTTTEALELAQLSVLAALGRVVPEEG